LFGTNSKADFCGTIFQISELSTGSLIAVINFPEFFSVGRINKISHLLVFPSGFFQGCLPKILCVNVCDWFSIFHCACVVNKLNVFLFIKIRSGIYRFLHASGYKLFLLELEIRSGLKKINRQRS
jgi:hypothetical protein